MVGLLGPRWAKTPGGYNRVASFFFFNKEISSCELGFKKNDADVC